MILYKAQCEFISQSHESIEAQKQSITKSLFMMIRLIAFCLFASFIASCGGGEDSPTSNPTSSGGGVVSTPQTYLFDKTLEGVWQGSGPPNTVVFAIIDNVNNDGKFWLAYGAPKELPTGTKAITTWNGFKTLDGFVHGTLKTSNGVVTSSDLKDFTRTGKNYPLSLAGTYVAGSSFKATLSSTGASNGIDTKPAPSTSYIYGSIPKLSDLNGAWTGKELVGNNDATVTVTTSSPGSSAVINVEVGTVLGKKCVFDGNVLPRISSIASENLFDVTLTIKDASCSTEITGTAVSAGVKVTRVGVKSTSGSGTGASFNITKAVSQTTYGSAKIEVAELGSGYGAGDTIILSGAKLGGVDGINDITFKLLTTPFSGSGVATTQKTADGKPEILIMLTSQDSGFSFFGAK